MKKALQIALLRAYSSLSERAVGSALKVRLFWRSERGSPPPLEQRAHVALRHRSRLPAPRLVRAQAEELAAGIDDEELRALVARAAAASLARNAKKGAP